jgi:tetratricopeptide (TPR) repeat protein
VRATAGALATLVLATTPQFATAQAQPIATNSTVTPMGRAAMFERNGAWGDAATQYAIVLKTQPASVGALIGMEHVLPRLDRRSELLPILRTALAADSTSAGVLAVVVRTFASMGEPDSARKYVAQWAAHAPNDGDPYREWSDAALMARDLLQARLALDVGREKLGPGTLGIERAELFQRVGDLAAAVQEWLAAIRVTPAFRGGAVSMLVQAPPAGRQVVRDALQKDGSRDARQLLGLLLVQWGEPSKGAAMVQGALPNDAIGAPALLRELDDALRPRPDKPSQLAHAATLEAIASREANSAAVRTLMDAARVYADAGDEQNARRLLAVVAANPAAPSGVASNASATLLGVLIAEGKPAEAEHVFGEIRATLTLDDRDALARRIAMAWVRSGDFARAEQLIATDSSTAGFDLRGRFQLYRGDLAGANDLLKQAGPFDDEREQALERVTLLTLIQAVGQDSSPPLGQALLQLERGDSVHAIAGLMALAPTLNAGGAAETRLLAGRLKLARHDTSGAQELFHQADTREFPAAAAAARLALAQLSIGAGREGDARSILEQLIIDFPESAVVPQARYLRDTLRGAVPGGRE